MKRRFLAGAGVVVAAALSLGFSSSPTGDERQRPGEDAPQAVAGKCRHLGVAAPAAWEHMSDREFRTMIDEQVAMGSSWIRLSAVWKDIEWQRGRPDWSGLDQRVDSAVDAGLAPVLMIHQYPDWVEGFGVIGSGAAGHYADFAAAVADRYGDRVDHYEIWNEPNLERFWPDPDPDSYAELLTAAAPRITAADPGAEIISGGLAPAVNDPGYSVAPLDFLGRLYELGANRYVTGLGWHPYSYPEHPTDTSSWNAFFQLHEAIELKARHGDADKQIWLTEYGAPTRSNRGVGEQEQARMAVEALDIVARNPDLGPVFLYTMYDIDLGADDPESHFGLMNGPGDPKAAYTALQEATRECRG